MLEEILIAGFGGQGVLSTGQLIAYSGMLEGRQVSWIPSYGPEMRGGTANCGVTVSDEPISSPLVTEPSTLLVMNRPSLDKFEDAVQPGGLIMINSSLVDQEVKRTDVRVMKVAANKYAEELGNIKVANNIILGALIQLTGIVSVPSVVESLKKVLPARRHNLIPVNQQAIEKGIELAKAFQATAAF